MTIYLYYVNAVLNRLVYFFLKSYIKSKDNCIGDVKMSELSSIVKYSGYNIFALELWSPHDLQMCKEKIILYQNLHIIHQLAYIAAFIAEKGENFPKLAATTKADSKVGSVIKSNNRETASATSKNLSFSPLKILVLYLNLYQLHHLEG